MSNLIASEQECLDVLLRLAERLTTEKDQKKLLHNILTEAIEVIRADRGAIFVLNADKGSIQSCFAIGLKEDITLDLYKGVVGDVIQKKKIVNIEDAYQDERFCREVDKKTGYRTKSIICTPITKSDGSILGAFELLNSKMGKFSERDLNILRILSMFASIVIEHQSTLSLLQNENKTLRNRLTLERGNQLVGSSHKMQLVQEMIATVANYSSHVIVLGESGTGKEIVSRLIHELSDRKEGPFIALNCAAIPENLLEAEIFGIEGGVATGVKERVGKMELAHTGTLFLDELGDMSPLTQSKLLRAIQEKSIERVGGKETILVDVRILAATNKDLKKEIEEGNFREDLYYRLNVLEIKLPPLRERVPDIPTLVEHFLQKHNQEAQENGRGKKQFAPECLELFINYNWPGNIRQLENEVEKAFVMSGEAHQIYPQHLSEDIVKHFKEAGGSTPSYQVTTDGLTASPSMVTLDIKDKSLKDVVNDVERLLVIQALNETGGNKTQTAKKLKLSREGLRKMLARLKIES